MQLKVLTELDFSDLDATGKLQFFGKAMDGSSILVWTGARHAAPKSQPDWDRELKYLFYVVERARRQGSHLLT